MKTPLHDYDFKGKWPVLIIGSIHGQAVVCKRCGVVYWSSEKIRGIDDICEYARHGCTEVAEVFSDN